MRIGIKITLLLVSVVIVAITSATTFSSSAISKAFNTYFQNNQSVRMEEIASAIAEYYKKNGWVEFDNSFFLGVGRGRGPGMGMGMGMRRQFAERITVTDRTGKIVADSLGRDVGQYYKEQEPTSTTPIIVDGEQVGTLIAPSGTGKLEDNFITSVKMANIKAGLLATILALAVGIYLSSRITKPLELLSEAARRIAGRELSYRVPITTKDEIGEVGGTFNQMVESLEKNELLRKNLIADVAHELRTPLAILRGNLELLQEKVIEPSPDVLASLHEESIRISRLVEDLQSLSHADAGEILLDRQIDDLVQIVKTVVKELSPEAAKKEIDIEFSAPAAAEILVDKYRIEQVLYNLISNAIRYSDHGSIIIKVINNPNNVLIEIQDAGSGIPEEHLPHIFDRFYRADKSRNRTRGGSGLGLAIAKSFIEAHGGRIWAESIVGEGSKFSFMLPKLENM